MVQYVHEEPKLKVIGTKVYQLCSMYVTYVSHQNEKETAYGPRTREVEKDTLTPAGRSTSGGMGKEMDVLVR